MMWTQLVFLCVLGCTRSLTRSFDLSGVVSGNRMGGVPLGRALGDGELDVEGVCAQPGLACHNCTHAVTCVSLPVGWLKVPLQQCPAGETCNAHEGGCGVRPVPECDVTAHAYTHTCEQVGIFPDAFDCRKFHLCSPPEGLPGGRPADHREAMCPRHYGYNPQTAQCSIKLANGQCQVKPVPDCKTIGQTDVLATSPNHYFVCLSKRGELYPQVFICPHGWYFWGGFCRPEQQTKVSPNTEKTTGSTTATDKIATEEDMNTNTDIENNDNETKHVTSRIESFFSTEKAATYPADTFLADKFDLANYETTDDVAPPVDDFVNSFESGGDYY